MNELSQDPVHGMSDAYYGALAEQVVRMSCFLEGVKHAGSKTDWNSVIFHEHPLHVPDAKHWLQTAHDKAHAGTIEPLAACAVVFAKWLLVLDADARDLPKDFIEFYYEKVLGFIRHPDETDDALVSRAQARLESRKRILTRGDIKRVIENEFGHVVLNEQFFLVEVASDTLTRHPKNDADGLTTVTVNLVLRAPDPTLANRPAFYILQKKIDAIRDRALKQADAEIQKTRLEGARQVQSLEGNKKTIDAYLATLPSFKNDQVGSRIAKTMDWLIERVRAWTPLGGGEAPNPVQSIIELVTEPQRRAAAEALKKEMDDLIDKQISEVQKLHKAQEARQIAHYLTEMQKAVERLVNEIARSKADYEQAIRSCASPFINLEINGIEIPDSPTPTGLPWAFMSDVLSAASGAYGALTSKLN